MKTNVKATNLELTPALRAYLAEKMTPLTKLFGGNGDEIIAQVEIGKESKHHKHGEVFRAEINLRTGGRLLRAVATSLDLYAAIDEMRDEISREIKSAQTKRAALAKRGGRVAKRLLTGNG